jgi:hypothetical protein
LRQADRRDPYRGLVPPVTYGPNRRVGIRGAYGSAVDLERRTLLPASGWIDSAP